MHCKPQESCAILLGRDDGGTAIVTEVHIHENVDRSSTSFSISGSDLIKTYTMAQRGGLEVVGIFHSHPASEAYPSATDERFMLGNPIVWVISGRSEEMRAFTLGKDIQEIPITDKTQQSLPRRS